MDRKGLDDPLRMRILRIVEAAFSLDAAQTAIQNNTNSKPDLNKRRMKTISALYD